MEGLREAACGRGRKREKRRRENVDRGKERKLSGNEASGWDVVGEECSDRTDLHSPPHFPIP